MRELAVKPEDKTASDLPNVTTGAPVLCLCLRYACAGAGRGSGFAAARTASAQAPWVRLARGSGRRRNGRQHAGARLGTVTLPWGRCTLTQLLLLL